MTTKKNEQPQQEKMTPEQEISVIKQQLLQSLTGFALRSLENAGEKSVNQAAKEIEMSVLSLTGTAIANASLHLLGKERGEIKEIKP